MPTSPPPEIFVTKYPPTDNDKAMMMIHNQKWPSYLRLEGWEWQYILDDSPDSGLIPCCIWVDEMRNTIRDIYAFNLTQDSGVKFVKLYNLLHELHNMSYAHELHKLCEAILKWLQARTGIG